MRLSLPVNTNNGHREAIICARYGGVGFRAETHAPDGKPGSGQCRFFNEVSSGIVKFFHSCYLFYCEQIVLYLCRTRVTFIYFFFALATSWLNTDSCSFMALILSSGSVRASSRIQPVYFMATNRSISC